jgi:hypothetical protein
MPHDLIDNQRSWRSSRLISNHASAQKVSEWERELDERVDKLYGRDEG